MANKTVSYKKIPIKYLRHKFHYDPDTGLFHERFGDPISGIFVLGRERFARKPGKNSYIGCGVTNGHGLHATVPAHVLAWALHHGEWPTDQIDHKNHVRSDNRIENLRVVTNLINSQNLSPRPNNKSGVMGVHWHVQSRKWMAKIKYQGRTIYLGTYADLQEAADARKRAELAFGFHPNHGKPPLTLSHFV
jgi:hypothetical protein